MTEAEKFTSHMENVWEDSAIVYDQFHDARKMLKVQYPHKKLWPQKRGGEFGYVYELADGSRVWIATHGSACVAVRKRGERA